MFFIRFVTNGGDIFLNDDDFGDLKSTLDKEEFYFFNLPYDFWDLIVSGEPRVWMKTEL